MAGVACWTPHSQVRDLGRPWHSISGPQPYLTLARYLTPLVVLIIVEPGPCATVPEAQWVLCHPTFKKGQIVSNPGITDFVFLGKWLGSSKPSLSFLICEVSMMKHWASRVVLRVG